MLSPPSCHMLELEQELSHVSDVAAPARDERRFASGVLEGLRAFRVPLLLLLQSLVNPSGSGEPFSTMFAMATSEVEPVPLQLASATSARADNVADASWKS